MQRLIGHHLAELNIGRVRYDLDDVSMAELSFDSHGASAQLWKTRCAAGEVV